MLCPPPGWVVKLPRRLPQERARHTGAVPFCLQEHARPTGVVPVPGGGGGGSSGGSGGRGRSTPRGRSGRGRRRGRRGRRRPQPSPSLPWTPSRSSPQATPRESPPTTLNQADLQRRLRMLLQDQEQLTQGREIANVTMTNSIVTSYKQGGRPTVQSNSSRFSS